LIEARGEKTTVLVTRMVISFGRRLPTAISSLPMVKMNFRPKQIATAGQDALRTNAMFHAFLNGTKGNFPTALSVIQ